MSKLMMLACALATLVLMAVPASLHAQEPEGLSQLEKSGSWESFLRQEGDYTTAVYEAAFPSQSSQIPYSLTIARLYPDCDRTAITYYLTPAAKEELKHSGLPGTVKVEDQIFNITYEVESDGGGVFVIRFTSFDPALVEAMQASGQSMEITLPNLDDFTISVSLTGFAEAWARTRTLCGQGLGVRLF